MAQTFLIPALVVCVVLLALAVIVNYRTDRELRRLQRGTQRFARGDLSRRLSVTGPGRTAELAAHLNWMAAQLADRLETVARQRNELEATLSSMVEGVLAIDLEQRILSLNAVAATMVEQVPDRVLGRSLQEVVRSSALQDLARRATRSDSPVREEIDLRVRSGGGGSLRHVQTVGSPLRDADGRRIGALLVLHDVTERRQLERMRRDFVANASHEIRTPVATIRSASEALTDERRSQDPELQRVGRIVARQAERLDAIVDDLLSLTRIEQAAERQQIAVERTPLASVLHAAVETCAAAAEETGADIQVDCDEALEAPVHAQMLEHAVVNLLENAAKHAGGGPIRAAAWRADGEVVVEVADHGPGIDPEHLPRLFERFYRPDPARSRQRGGTGLGLSIVKHVAQAHHGRVSVDSEPGHGSVFRIHLPRVALGDDGGHPAPTV